MLLGLTVAGVAYGASYGVVRATGMLHETKTVSIGCTLVGPCQVSTHHGIEPGADAPTWIGRLYGFAITLEERARFD